MELHKLEFWTSHHQFYLADKSSPFRTDSDDFWTTEASNDKLAIEEGILGIGTECYGPVKGDFVVLKVEPEENDFGSYDHVVEGSIELKSGVLQVFPCAVNEPVLELSVAPRTYRVRIYSSNLTTVEGDAGDDYYRVRMWPGEAGKRKVLKR